MDREIIFWFGLLVLFLTMTGGIWMFLESSRSFMARTEEEKRRDARNRVFPGVENNAHSFTHEMPQEGDPIG